MAAEKAQGCQRGLVHPGWSLCTAPYRLSHSFSSRELRLLTHLLSLSVLLHCLSQGHVVLPKWDAGKPDLYFLGAMGGSGLTDFHEHRRASPDGLIPHGLCLVHCGPALSPCPCPHLVSPLLTTAHGDRARHLPCHGGCESQVPAPQQPALFTLHTSQAVGLPRAGAISSF